MIFLNEIQRVYRQKPHRTQHYGTFSEHCCLAYIVVLLKNNFDKFQAFDCRLYDVFYTEASDITDG